MANNARHRQHAVQTVTAVVTIKKKAWACAGQPTFSLGACIYNLFRCSKSIHILACNKVIAWPSNIGCETPYNPSIWCSMIQNTMMGKHVSQPISHISQLVSPTICYLAASDCNPNVLPVQECFWKNNRVLFPQDLVCSVQVQGVTLQAW